MPFITPLCRGAAPLMLALAVVAMPASAQDFCQRELTLPRPAVAATLATLALGENQHLGGSFIAADGGLTQQGFYEAERDHLPGDSEPAWQRVWDYWRAVPDVYARDFAPLEALGSTAQQRVALIDRPWSAAFISWVMRSAGFTDSQFAFSALHSDYVHAALQATADEAQGAPSDFAYRACDLAQTAPRVGDLLCFARADDASLATFDAVRAAVLQGSIPMHCDLVVRQDAASIDTVGGNVVQSVTLRRMRLADDGSGRLWPAYLESAHRAQIEALTARPAAGTSAALLPDTGLSQQPWSVLLQLRQTAAAAPAAPATPVTPAAPVAPLAPGAPGTAPATQPPAITPDSIYRN